MKPWVLGGAPPQIRLTPRQLQVSRLVSQNMTTRQIAATLGLKPGTIQIFLTQVFQKCHFASRSEIAEGRKLWDPDWVERLCNSCHHAVDETEEFPCTECGKRICVYCRVILAAAQWVCRGCADRCLSHR